MLISLLTFLLVSNAVTLRRDKSILFSRVVIKSLLFASFLAFNNLFTQTLEKDIHAGLTQFTIKTLFAYSTISHVGFTLLALFTNKAESIQACIFYILQYSLSNISAFIILVTIGYSLYLYVYKEKEYNTLNNETVRFNPNNITINSALSSTISILTLLLILFIYIPGEWFNVVIILTIILFKA